MSGRKPDYRVAIMNKRTDEKNGNAGGAWVDADRGYISISLNGFVAIPADPDIVITLFPIKRESEE